jgi:hypothetical protein
MEEEPLSLLFGLPRESVKVEEGDGRLRYYRKHMMGNAMACLSRFVIFWSIIYGSAYAMRSRALKHG